MSMPEKFVRAWPDVDPNLKHGGIAGVTDNGGWVGADINDNLSTTNKDLHSIVYWLSQALTSVSMNPEADAQGMPGKRLVDQCLKVAETFTEMVVDVTHSHASKFFQFTHAVPPRNWFKITPIMYPVRSSFADDFLHYGIGTIIELAENNRNSLHKGLDSQASNIILEATYTWKAQVMRYWFDKETAGDISTRELESLYQNVRRSVPSYPDETMDTADPEAVQEALSGLDVLAWVPTNSDWTKFAELRNRRYEPEAIFQPEDTRQTTEDVLPPTGVNPSPISTGGPTP